MIGLLSIALAFPGLAAEPGGVAGRLQYERALEAKVDRLLEDVLGARSARVFIEATLDQSVTEEAVERLVKEAEAGQDAELELPGFRRPPAPPPPPAARRLSSEPQPLRRLSVRLVADPGLKTAQLRDAEELVRQVLPIVPDRGDELVVLRAPLRETWDKLLERPWLRVAGAAAALLLFLGGVLVFLGALAARRAAVQAVRQIREDLALSAPYPGGPVLDAVPALPAPAVGLPDRTFALRFVTGQNLRLVARFLETRPPAAARWVLGTLEPDSAAALFRLLPVATRQAAAIELAAPKPGKPPTEAELHKLAEELREFLEREAKGTGLLQEILVRSPEALRKAVLDSVRIKAPGALSRVQAGLMRFDELERADAGSLVLLVRETTSEDLAVALRGCRPSLCDKLLASLPAVLRDSAKRRIGQKGDEAQTLSARAAILARWRELEASGKVRPL